MSSPKVVEAKISPSGQITLPKEAQKILNVSEGDRVCMILEDDKIIVTNEFVAALRSLQEKMEPELEKAGLNSEEDIIKLCREIRKESGIL
ncbi:MAG: AbrB/MazE/SpoVT family DNA-binding domain-containing protein [Deltaproteobacteria bacterium]|jgi:AbrB family looped-hinge helix DNA binding protein|nr:AbrB/MazE/SpoVT family DNA-binding domain-containing protein [Deltaproteobacteria bacterium]